MKDWNSKPLYEKVKFLHEMGYSLSEIASTLFPDVYPRKKALNRVNTLLYYALNREKLLLRRSKRKENEEEEKNYALEKRYYISLEGYSPALEGTLDIVTKKKYATPEERQRYEYEQQLYNIYKEYIKPIERKTNILWLAIRRTFLKTFPQFWKQFRRKYFITRRRKFMPVETAIYIFFVIDFSLAYLQDYLPLRRKIWNHIYGKIRAKEKTRIEEVKRKLLPLFAFLI